MKISDVEKATGLTAKAIRLYEEKGLISVNRSENTYRDYSESQVSLLKEIKILRDLGIGISEICLYFNEVISLQELLNKRKKDIESENATNRKNYDKCLQLLYDLSKKKPNASNGKKTINESAAILGIDIGTTNISTVIIDIEKNYVLETYTVVNDSKLTTDKELSEFDANWITNKAKLIVDYLIEAYPNIKSIGITGQMHGIVYVGKDGEWVSPLYNWQDNRSNQVFGYNKTYCREIFERTGYTVFPGYGFSTLFYNNHRGIEPKNATSFCTIMDYFAMTLSGNTIPLIHPTNAASFGLYDLQNNCFDCQAINKLGLSHLSLPTLAKDDDIVGYYKNIPISVAIGDNQASFFGSVRQENTRALVNFGTGSQISVVSEHPDCIDENLEIRPYLFGKYLLCGSALCGGKAYSILERFFSKYVAATTNNVSSQYEVMNSLAEKAYSQKEALKVSTQFCGTRANPDLRGAITEISDDNLTPENLILGVLQGMCNELKTYFDRMETDHITSIIASGNAVKKNPVLKNLLKDTFHLPVELMSYNEEAAIGVALYAAISNGVIKIDQINEIAVYTEGNNNELG